MRQSLALGADDVVKAILEAAKAGDMQAAKIVMDRLLPPLRATAQTVNLDIPAAALLNLPPKGQQTVRYVLFGRPSRNGSPTTIQT